MLGNKKNKSKLMASITYTRYSTNAGNLNPTINRLPVRTANGFQDSYIRQTDAGSYIVFECDGIVIDGNVIAPTAGSFSGDYLVLLINSTEYKVELLSTV